MTLYVDQGDETYEIEPVRGSRPVEEFLASGEGDEDHTNSGLERSEASQLFVYDGPEGRSLVLLHDAPDDGTGGGVSMEFATLPADGEWVVTDDDGDEYGRERADWDWMDSQNDGGAFRGGFDDEFELYVSPELHRGIDDWYVLSGGGDDGGDEERHSETAFEVENDWSSADRTSDWTEVEHDLSEFRGQRVTIQFQADGRHTYDWQDTTSWIKASYVEVDGAFREEFAVRPDERWTCESEERGSGYDDTPTRGFCEYEDGVAHVQEETNRVRYLRRTVEVPDEPGVSLRARVKAHVSASWSHARLAVIEADDGRGAVERTALDEEPILLREGEASYPIEVATSAATLSYIPGGSENSTWDENASALHSGLPHFFPDEYEITARNYPEIGDEFVFGSVSLPVGPLFDNWHTGDHVRPPEYPETLAEAKEPKYGKYEEFPNEEFNQYRFRNEVRTTFNVRPDGTIDDDTLAVEHDAEGSYSIHELEEINNYPLEWADGAKRLEGGLEPELLATDRVAVDGTNGVRISAICGSYIEYAAILADKVRDEGLASTVAELWDWPDLARDVLALTLDKALGTAGLTDMLTAVPSIFTFLDVVVLADGRTLVRLWDHSMFPKHALYVDGLRAFQSQLETEDRERYNGYFIGFFAEKVANTQTPYGGAWLPYESWLTDPEADVRAAVEETYATLQDTFDPEDLVQQEYEAITHDHPVAYRGADATDEGADRQLDPDAAESLMAELDEELLRPR